DGDLDRGGDRRKAAGTAAGTAAARAAGRGAVDVRGESEEGEGDERKDRKGRSHGPEDSRASAALESGLDARPESEEIRADERPERDGALARVARDEGAVVVADV